MIALLFILKLVCISSALFLMWICYKRQEKRYLSATATGAIFYQLVSVEISSDMLNVAFNIAYITLLWIAIKAYSNKINEEHNKQLLAKMEADYKKFATKPKSKSLHP